MSIENLHKSWVQLSEKYFKNDAEIAFLWNKIKNNYSSKNRYYHNLMHIASMLEKASENKNEIHNYDELRFAIWFHDIIYTSTSKRNEEKSADFAKSALKNIVKQKIDVKIIYQLIISTKKHQIILNNNFDNAFLLDFDLSILGQEWKIYENYIQNIRKEYKIYPDFLYNPARKKVLLSFLNREKLYFTNKYQDLFEEKARQNLTKEIELLS
ncbi:HD domain-containing protein [Polaribacter porphyrae]|uniref:Metal-dependent HD superfamily phosphohydrolase n=1 Tax=Polaribacter porphyrae TaxID=1137780 RepID=A0A2S7WQE8_9FLAO|nr:hypothetical protein [Polaribacter porphyrae]PQJ79837.1 hypothetical protein BTO18_11910 [Polaribacter porphyrae]